MIYTVSNDYLAVSVEDKGAELMSITDKATAGNYLYDGKGGYRNERAPVLFPFVGRLKNGVYRYNGAEYEMPIHGFARFLDYECEQGGDTLRFCYTANKKRADYPFLFTLRIDYTLKDREVVTDYTVINNGDNDMFFSIGGHPGFICPFYPGESFSDYYIVFEKQEDAVMMPVTGEGLFSREVKRFCGGLIPLSYELFKNDALVFTGLKSNCICLNTKKHTDYIRVGFSGFEYLGIWTVPGAGFICIEPWNGHGDYEDFTGDISEKPGIIKLAPGGEYHAGFEVELFIQSAMSFKTASSG